MSMSTGEENDGHSSNAHVREKMVGENDIIFLWSYLSTCLVTAVPTLGLMRMRGSFCGFPTQKICMF